MAKRASLRLLNATQLGEMLRMKPGTVRDRLTRAGVEPQHEDAQSRWFDSREALSALLAGEKLDLTTERARLAKEQADAQELKNAMARGELVPASDQDAAVVNLMSATRQRVLAVPSKTAQETAASEKPAECHAIIERAIHDALQELAEEGEQALERLRDAEDATSVPGEEDEGD